MVAQTKFLTELTGTGSRICRNHFSRQHPVSSL